MVCSRWFWSSIRSAHAEEKETLKPYLTDGEEGEIRDVVNGSCSSWSSSSRRQWSNLEHTEIRVSSAGSLSRLYALLSFYQWPIHVDSPCWLSHSNRLFSFSPPQLVSCSGRPCSSGDTDAGAELGT